LKFRPGFNPKNEQEDDKNDKKGGNKKGKIDKKGQPAEEKHFEKPSKADNHGGGKKKKGKGDPADDFDPLNFKPSNTPTTEDQKTLKDHLATYEHKCSTCPFGTNTQEEFKAHFKCEWHKANLKRKVAEQEPLTEEQFKEFCILKEFA